MLAIKACIETYLKSLVEMGYSGEQLTYRFCDYVNEPGSPLLEPAKHAASVWQNLQKGASRALEEQFNMKVRKTCCSICFVMPLALDPLLCSAQR